MIPTLTVMLLGVLLSGCAGSHGFDRDAMRAFLHPPEDLAPKQLVTPPTNTQRLSLPFRLALYFVHTDIPAPHPLRKPEWVSADTDLLISRLAPLQQEQILSDMFLLMDPTIRSQDMQMIRKAAARYGADAVLIVEGVGAVDRYQNGYAALYPTLIGAYMAPGTNSDALFIIQGTLQDVRSERRYETHKIEGQAHTVGPTMFVEDRQAIARAKQTALDELGQRMVEILRAFKNSTPKANDGLR